VGSALLAPGGDVGAPVVFDGSSLVCPGSPSVDGGSVGTPPADVDSASPDVEEPLDAGGVGEGFEPVDVVVGSVFMPVSGVVFSLLQASTKSTETGNITEPIETDARFMKRSIGLRQ